MKILLLLLFGPGLFIGGMHLISVWGLEDYGGYILVGGLILWGTLSWPKHRDGSRLKW